MSPQLGCNTISEAIEIWSAGRSSQCQLVWRGLGVKVAHKFSTPQQLRSISKLKAFSNGDHDSSSGPFYADDSTNSLFLWRNPGKRKNISGFTSSVVFLLFPVLCSLHRKPIFTALLIGEWQIAFGRWKYILSALTRDNISYFPVFVFPLRT